MTTADKQALWDAYLVASANQDKADKRAANAQHELMLAEYNAVTMERRADDAYEAWENA